MVFIRIVAAEWAHTNVSGFPHISSKLHINRIVLQKRHSDFLTSSEVHGSLEKCILACNLHGLDFICCMFGSRYVCPHSHILLFSLVLNFATFYLFTCSCPIVLFLACNVVSCTML